MARTELTIRKCTEFNKFSEPFAFLTAAIGAEGAEFVHEDRDNKYLVMLTSKQETEAVVTIHHGNGLQGVSDLVITLAPKARSVVCLESGRFKNVSGEDKGKIIITQSVGSDIKITVFKLP